MCIRDSQYNDGYSSGYEDGYVAGQEDSENIYYDSYAYYDSDIYNKGFFDGIERAMECVQLENLSSEANEDLDYYYDKYSAYVYGLSLIHLLIYNSIVIQTYFKILKGYSLIAFLLIALFISP